MFGVTKKKATAVTEILVLENLVMMVSKTTMVAESIVKGLQIDGNVGERHLQLVFELVLISG